ncbi:uncharacterized protein ACA1_304360 [Acanthamoeba castellanii str. Neff]|uniref:Uncharacterized protein n=1 Tax=Acanthamoeba castellanii (strain ATCC 30010 / Neff) TaxID=1257118 RepID=L8GUY5_ACACF|nr:uncharacterized protein ACA1_304360 [Acanthamoeba castellanii str. Neff]ELR16994.1 hypothetical protein ACA1_304360 [Acanthamoeba castellanii str. Neff]
MGYETDFEGELNIRPRLADEFVARFNDVASRRNNVYGDGDEGSFDHLVFGKRGTAAGARVQERYDNPAWTGVPSCWNAWQLKNEPGKTCTILHWEGNSKFYNYVQWLQFVVDYIIRENQALAPLLNFQGAITWNQDRTDCDDKGVLTLKRVQEKWKVVATVETPYTVLLPMQKSAREFREVWSPFYRGGYCPVLLPGPRKEGMVESKRDAVHADDPCEKPECRLTDQGGQLEVFVQPRLPSLLHLCLSVAATNLARSAEPAAQPLESLPEELQRELRRGGRHCSGCGRLFWGAAGANVFVLLSIMFDGLPMLGRYCSVHCWREEVTDARARIDAVRTTGDDDDDDSDQSEE